MGGVKQRDTGRPGEAVAQGLRARKRDQTHRRIADEAVRLVSTHGIASTTVDQIARAAGVGRATFFRYFDTKELAIAAGLSDVARYVFTATLRKQPAQLQPLEAILSTFQALSVDFDEHRSMYLEQAQLSRTSAAMMAWTLHLYVDWEISIADAVAPRFDDLDTNDVRPRMLGAMSMAAARLACDEWLAQGGVGDLPTMMQERLGAFALSAPGRSRH